MSNPSREPYLNSSKILNDKGTKGVIVVHPIVSGGGGTGEILHFSGFSGHNSGDISTKPGRLTLNTSVDTNIRSKPDIEWSYKNLSPIAHGAGLMIEVDCIECWGTMYSECMGLPGCLAPHSYVDNWSPGVLHNVYYGPSGVSGVTILAQSSSTSQASVSFTTHDECPRTYPGSAGFGMEGIVSINQPHVEPFGGTIEKVASNALNYLGSNMGSPIQLPYIDSETKNGLEVSQIGYLKSFSGSSGCSGFSGFSGSSGFSASTGCSGI